MNARPNSAIGTLRRKDMLARHQQEIHARRNRGWRRHRLLCLRSRVLSSTRGKPHVRVLMRLLVDVNILLRSAQKLPTAEPVVAAPVGRIFYWEYVRYAERATTQIVRTPCKNLRYNVLGRVTVGM
jgi:hypothetical protein